LERRILITLSVKVVFMESEIKGIVSLLYQDTAKKVKKSSTRAKNEVEFHSAKHLFTYKNSAFDEFLYSCLIYNNWGVLKAINPKFIRVVDGKTYLLCYSEAKYKTWLELNFIDKSTGEFTSEIKETDSIIRQRGKMVKKLREFDRIYKPLYKQRKVSMLFITLTDLPNGKHTIISFFHEYKRRLKRNGLNLLGYVWSNEVKFKFDAEGNALRIHVHYHLILSIERIECKGQKINECLRHSYLTELWGRRVDMQFIKHSTATGKYLAAIGYLLGDDKNGKNGGVLGLRKYSSSRNYSIPE
jgi:hypothetical protein